MTASSAMVESWIDCDIDGLCEQSSATVSRTCSRGRGRKNLENKPRDEPSVMLE